MSSHVNTPDLHTMGKSSRLAIVLAGSRVFFLGMLALLLTLPSFSGVGADTFAYNGFKEDSLHLVSDSSWVFNSTTCCFHFDPAEFGVYYSASGRLLYPGAVQMKDPGATTVKSFSTSFIYQLRMPTELGYTGPGMAFILVPDNVTLGAPVAMGLITEETFETAKNKESDDHTLGVELDTYMNPEFNDTNNNHIGINLASMNSTYSFKPVYFLASIDPILYQQIWIDYFEADSRMDIYYANYNYKQAKPSTPQGSQSGLDFSLLKENLFTGFATAKGIENTNIAYVCAWSFSNDGIPAPSIVIAQDATPGATPPPANGPVAAPSRPPPASIPSLPPPVPSQGHNSEPPTSTKKGGKKRNLGVYVGVPVSLMVSVGMIICIIVSLCWCRFLSRPVRIFISHAGGQDGSQKNFPTWLDERMRAWPWSVARSRVRIFFDTKDVEYGKPMPKKILRELAAFDVGVVVVTNDFFETKWPMTELIAFVKAQKNDRSERIRVLPLFYELLPEEVTARLFTKTWEVHWEKMSEGNHPLSVEECTQAVTWLCQLRGILYDYKKRNRDRVYIETICKEVDAILCKEGSFASYLMGAVTDYCIPRHCKPGILHDNQRK